MRRAAVLLGRRALAGQAAAQVAGMGVLALAVAVEAADVPIAGLFAELRARVPAMWGQAAPALALLGAAMATARMKRQGVVLGLGTLGLGTRAIVAAAALAGVLVGLGVLGAVDVAPAVAPGEWVRGVGGWWRDGVAYADPGVANVGAPVPPAGPGVAAVVGAATAAALGAGLGLVAGAPEALIAAALVVVGEAMARGLVQRGAMPAVGAFGPAAIEAVVVAVVFNHRGRRGG